MYVHSPTLCLKAGHVLLSGSKFINYLSNCNTYKEQTLSAGRCLEIRIHLFFKCFFVLILYFKCEIDIASFSYMPVCIIEVASSLLSRSICSETFANTSSD